MDAQQIFDVRVDSTRRRILELLADQGELCVCELTAALSLSQQTHLGEAVHFVFYDTPKVLLLLTGIVFIMGVVHTFVAPERTRALLSGRRLGVGNIMAAGRE